MAKVDAGKRCGGPRTPADVGGLAQRQRVAWMTVLVLLVVCGVPARAAFNADGDGDTIADATDNCVAVPNEEQVDTDEDEIGDACDMCAGTIPDVAGGTVSPHLAVDQFGCSMTQLCPCRGPRMGRAPWRHRSRFLRCVHREARRLDRLDAIVHRERSAFVREAKATSCGKSKGVAGDRDGDGILEDGDHDGIAGNHPCASRATEKCDDNCPGRRNRDQVDLDGNGRGNRCDLDIDGDKVKNRRDNCPRAENAGQEDGDEDGVGDACDDCKDSADNANVESNGCD